MMVGFINHSFKVVFFHIWWNGMSYIVMMTIQIWTVFVSEDILVSMPHQTKKRRRSGDRWALSHFFVRLMDMTPWTRFTHTLRINVSWISRWYRLLKTPQIIYISLQNSTLQFLKKSFFKKLFDTQDLQVFSLSQMARKNFFKLIGWQKSFHPRCKPLDARAFKSQKSPNYNGLGNKHLSPF